MYFQNCYSFLNNNALLIQSNNNYRLLLDRRYLVQKITPIVLSLIFVLSIITPCMAEPVTTIINNGDSSNRVDIAVLGDGYTASDLSKYKTDVSNIFNRFFKEEPFLEYKTFFNVHRIDVTSAESGADHPNTQSFKNTAFDAAYDCNNMARLICITASKVNAAVNRSLTPDKSDIIIVLVNDSDYGGSGGAIVVASTHASAVGLVLHELGHSFGLLADEYPAGSCTTSTEPGEPNITMNMNRNSIKWNTGGGNPQVRCRRTIKAAFAA